MSKSSSPTFPLAYPKAASELVARTTDVALRKKKNADAQAAFRARRTNYIATLEETVTSLESVVIQLQESCRESQTEAFALRQENNRLRMDQRERERSWQAFNHAKNTKQVPGVDDLAPPPPPLLSPFLENVQVATIPSHSAPSLVSQRYGDNLGYRNNPVVSQGPDNEPLSGSGIPTFSNQSFRAPFPSNDVSRDESPASSVNIRGSNYPQYSYPISNNWRWQAAPTGVGTGYPIMSPHSQSPPSLTSTKMSVYPSRFSADEQKVTMNTISYGFPNGSRFNQNFGDSLADSRSMSPTASTTSLSLPSASSFQFTFREAPSVQNCSESDCRRQSLPHCPEVTSQSGNADVSLTGKSSDVARYRASYRPDDHESILGTDDSAQREQSNGDFLFNARHVRSRCCTIPPGSRSPSPGLAPISSTIDVFKVHAFGALRKTRARTKKTSGSAAKVATDVLEARGIEIGSASAGSKRPRMDDKVIEAGTP